MCLAPIRIKNPYKGLSHIGYNYLHNCEDTYIDIPCGICSVCKALKQSYAVQRAQMESQTSHLFYITLTYNTEMIPTIQVNGYTLRYADYGDIQKMFKRLRKSNVLERPLKYYVVSDYGGKKHRPHFHLFLSVPKYSTDTPAFMSIYSQKVWKSILHEWRRNVAPLIEFRGKLVPDFRRPVWKPLCTYRKKFKNGRWYSNYDCHLVEPRTRKDGTISDCSDATFYINKYMLKASKYVDNLKSALKLNLEPEEFTRVWLLFRLRCLSSHNWGLGFYRSDEWHYDYINCRRMRKEAYISGTPKQVSEAIKNHIRKGIDFACNDNYAYPVFFNPNTGQTFPLSPYYRRIFVNLNDAHSFYYNQKSDNVKLLSPLEVDEIVRKKFVGYNAVLAKVAQYDLSDTHVETEILYKDENLYSPDPINDLLDSGLNTISLLHSAEYDFADNCFEFDLYDGLDLDQFDACLREFDSQS